jgi:hypothetical protein
VREIIEIEKENEVYDRDILVWWDNLKYKIKKIFSNFIFY